MIFPYNEVLQVQAAYKNGQLTREQATEKLSFLLDLDSHNDMCAEAMESPVYTFGSYGPLLRLSDVCNVLRLWARTYCTPLKSDDEYKKQERAKFYNEWLAIDLAISKSNLLARLFFTDEGLRSEPCPEHKGHWSGCWIGDYRGGPGPCACQAGGNTTGWLALDPKFCDRKSHLEEPPPDIDSDLADPLERDRNEP